jgi:hypothetical protein
MKMPWEAYHAGPAGRENWEEFSSVSHVTHIDNAVSIIQKQEIGPQLVFDESKLNESRTQVIWASPNHWWNGYRYGNIAFDLDWKELIDGKLYFWVEAMPEYHPTACRILITKRKIGDQLGLTQYDPASDKGPWIYNPRSEKHYRNKNLTLEFMIEEAIGTSEVTALSFVDHHQKMCSIDAMNCPNRGLSARKAAELYFSFLVGRGLKLPRNLITERRGKVTYLRDEVETAFEDIESRATASATFGGPITFNHSASGSLVRAILSEIARGSRIDRIAAASLFRSNDDLIKAIRREIRRVL